LFYFHNAGPLRYQLDDVLSLNDADIFAFVETHLTTTNIQSIQKHSSSAFTFIASPGVALRSNFTVHSGILIAVRKPLTIKIDNLYVGPGYTASRYLSCLISTPLGDLFRVVGIYGFYLKQQDPDLVEKMNASLFLEIGHNQRTCPCLPTVFSEIGIVHLITLYHSLG
jgi:hypothetical protein